MNRHSRFLGLLGAALVAAACGRGPELIDRTSPEYLRKSDFLNGTWYIQDTVVDVPPNSADVVIGFGGGVDKVRFEIQENYLVAYRTYEYIPGTDPLVDRQKSKIGSTVTLDGKPYRGAPVAAWPITKHFDRVRQYNAATGEQSNVLEENMSDQPWYKREFFHVNWSANVIKNAVMTTGGLMAPYKRYTSPLDPNQGDHGLVTEYRDRADGKKEMVYFDFTTRVFLDPASVYYEDYGNIPYCYLNPLVDCESTEVKIRTSIRKVDEAHVQDYEPLVYNDKLEKKFGYFRTERISYDRNRGVTESGRILYANRHNLWARAHDEQGNALPVQNREPKPIVYFAAPNWPQELRYVLKDIESSWDHAFRRAVAVPRGIKVEDAPQMFYVCETPVPENAPAACGPKGFVARLGDLRYNQIPFIDQVQLGMTGLLGLGPSAADPETGEIIQGVANVYGAHMDTWAGGGNQVIDLINGDISTAEFLLGKDSRDYVFEHLDYSDPRRPATGPWTGAQQGLASDPQRPLGAFARVQGDLAAKLTAYRSRKQLPVASQDRRQLVDALVAKNPQLESALLEAPEVRSLVLSTAPSRQFRSKLESDPAFFRVAARKMMLGVNPLQKEQQRFDQWRKTAQGCMYTTADFGDDSWYGTAKEIAGKAKQYESDLRAQGKTPADAKRLTKDYTFNLLRASAYRAVTEHELGHTLGLTHNFIGSFDAMNYQDGYWDLRKQTIGVMVAGKRVLPTLPQNLVDAAKPNLAQLDGKMREYQYSTIMDYASRMNMDRHGIGKYDNAAILFAYSGGGEPGYVEVFNDHRGKTPADYESPNVAVPTDNATKDMIVRGAHVEVPVAHVTHYTPVSPFYSDRFHYTTLPFHFADKNLEFEKALDQGIARMSSRSFRKWSEMEALYNKVDAEVVKFSLNQGGWGKNGWDESAEIMKNVGPMPVEVPYMYCSDAETGANIACSPGDQGADVYEITKDKLDLLQNYYLFNNFKRNRLSFSANTAFNSNYGRYMAALPNVYHQWLFNLYWTQDYYNLTTEQMEQYVGAGDPIWQNYWTMAVVDSTNALLQQMAKPSAGYHGKLASGNWVHLPDNTPTNGRLAPEAEARFINDVKARGFVDVVYVPRGPGRSMYTLYDTEGVDFQDRVLEIGHFVDQLGAMFAITTTETNFLGVDRGADQLRYSLPYYMTFNKELARLFGQVWSEDRGGYASGLVKTGNGEATIVPPVFVRGEDYISGFKYPAPQQSPVDSNGNALSIEKVEASPTWSTRFYSELYGMAFFTSNFDQEFASFNQVFRLGSGEQLSPSQGYTVETFADPFGGYVYAALRKTGTTSLPAAPQLVLNANQFKTKWDQAKSSGQPVDGLSAAQWEGRVRDSVRSLELMRGLYSVFSQTW